MSGRANAALLRVATAQQSPILGLRQCVSGGTVAGRAGRHDGGEPAQARHHNGSPSSAGKIIGRPFGSSAGAEEEGRRAGLLREFLHESLYHPRFGYFAAASGPPPVASLPAPLDFKRLLGRDGYNYSLRRAYQQLQVSWLTPSEIFSPHYGRGLAECVLSHHMSGSKSQQPLQVFELGAGTGTVARDFLDYVRECAPEVYAGMAYRTVEISNSLAALQRQKVAEEGGHAAIFDVENRDAAEAQGWKESSEPCYVLAMEVLDNMPHDRVVWDNGKWHETVVEWRTDKESGAVESLRAVSDHYVQRCMKAFHLSEEREPRPSRSGWLARWMPSTAASTDRVVFLPTGCLRLLDALLTRRPNHRLLAADFSALPDIQIAGRNAPLVSTTAGGRAVDHGTYLVPLGTADIFFPTDFEAMSRLYRIASHEHCTAAVAGASAEAHTVSDFMYSYADWKATATASGYNPLLEDFTNTQILLGNMTANIRRQQPR